MAGICWNRAVAPDRIPTDKVIPMYCFDDTMIYRTFVFYSMFVFDDVLDAHSLSGSLERLVKRDGWQKLGARLRRNVSC
jgi:hypothetical protein